MPDLSRVSPNCAEAEEQAEKINEIALACESRNLDAIRKLAISPEGLVNDSLRRTACKFFCHIFCSSKIDYLKGHCYWDAI